ncbi:translation initiation factor IF-2 [Marininema halotolerans]|uniref:Translation initiation factor IF-2 n=1 Tax=Marininema halotolerans TaxID=1155944 RepID=A0A1I6R4V3_9BACL|nr:translation initiation factor IF-2 [Marininema halotolerans]SFS59735.1 translation initiation factor IF-2 [Marininema halotolerans]
MSKIRVYEYAKNLDMSSKEVITILKRMGVEVNNHMSVMDDEAVNKVEKFFKDVKQGAEKTEQKTTHQKSESRNQGGQGNRSQGGGQGNRSQGGGQGNRSQGGGQGNRSQGGGQGNRSQGGGQGNRSQGGGQGNRSQGGGQGNRSQGGSQGNRSQGGSQGNRSQGGGQGNRSQGGGQGNRSQGNRSNQGGENRGGGDRRNANNRGGRSNFGGGGNRGGRRGGRRDNRRSQAPKQAPVLPSEIEVSGPMTVGEVARLLRREASEVIKKLISMGTMATINQEIDVDTIGLVSEEFGAKMNYKEKIDESAFENIEEEDDQADLKERPPVVTIMGHVDHGKTTLLDTIRQTKVTAGEAGGITQHIGAYQVEKKGKKVTFLDTPGHAAFTTMRARGAQVTDITILVVAADDGVMPQTIEAINHAKAAEVPIIVAVNKMDKPEANPDRVKQQLSEHGLVPEEWGGDAIFVPVSAVTGEGIDDILEMILLVSEVEEYKANPDKRARGVVIEAELDKGRGTVATILVQNGTLQVGDAVVAGPYFGKIRAMVNDLGKRVKTAGPSTPVEILGLADVPAAGDPFIVYEDEKKARDVAAAREQKKQQSELGASSRVTLDDLFKQIQEGDVKDLNVIIKADVQGSAEALRSSLEKIDVAGVRINIKHSGAGAITESDVTLASASNAIVIGFNVRPEPNARVTADQEKVDIRLHRVIYNVIEEIESAMKGMLDPEFREKVVGRAEVRQTFKVSKVGTIAGCYVTEGKIVRDGKAQLIRDGVVVHEGDIDALKRFKDDAKEVAQGYECGVTLKNYNDIHEGDIIEVFIMEEIAR